MKHITKHTILILLLNVYVGFQAYAQNQAINEPTQFYRKSQQYGGHLNSSGLGGINMRLGWHKTGKIKNILDLDFARVRDPKEFRRYGSSDNPQLYSFGRLNMAFFLHTGYGQTIKITERPYKNAIGLNFNYFAGVSTAFLKPIYLDIFYQFTDRSGGFIRPERYDPAIHTNQNLIFGNSTFLEGIEKTTTQFGGYGKASLSIEWGQFPDEFHNLEAGLTLDYFPTGLPLMANTAPRNVFLLLYIGYTYGLNK